MIKKKKSLNRKSLPSYKEDVQRTPNYTKKKGKFQDNRKVNVRKIHI